MTRRVDRRVARRSYGGRAWRGDYHALVPLNEFRFRDIAKTNWSSGQGVLAKEMQVKLLYIS